ncbi:dye decolorizing peroxidase [Sanguibacter gelidistatuariae]|uniref:Dye decolorizing peroxidase n=1 Tax=Sanguibacter gelidistatuariae TaxID=1814289 RepID=A0A1G6H6B3_9MICO|nr:Dyp-type peroxidase [Sanguibacter gelidistatuariae]SDB89809.1 dye decolorizing peroxidase [Sanguibacter gelidistatuariae]
MAEVSRRSALFGGVGLVGGALGGALAMRGAQAPSPDPGSAPGEGGGAPWAGVGQAVETFYGANQGGIATVPQARLALVAFDLLAGASRSTLVRIMRIWTDDAARLTRGAPGLTDTEPELATVPARLTVTVGYGPGVFEAAGLQARRPEWLAPLPPFSVDRLEEGWCGGDLVLQICADDEVTVAHAVRVLVKEVRELAQVRWVQRGFRRGMGTQALGTTMRNLMGQVDGTVQPDVAGVDVGLLWAGPGPRSGTGWLEGGTSLVVRRIRLELDTWDELDRPAREQVVGRRLADGAPLTGTAEHDDPDLEAVNTLGFPVIDVAAHIRRSRSEKPGERFLRRGYNYDEPPGAGVPGSSGLVFVTFQADPVAQLVPIQQRLAEMDLLNTWTTPIGSAVFAVPPGCQEGEYLGHGLFG